MTQLLPTPVRPPQVNRPRRRTSKWSVVAGQILKRERLGIGRKIPTEGLRPRHEILYQPSFSLAVVSLERGESIMAESGAMISMSPTIKLEAQMSGGGVFGAFKSAVGGEYIVDTGHIVAFENSVQHQLEKATGKSQGFGGFLKGMVQSALSGEGFVCRYRGPGRIYIQTRQFPSFARQLLPFLPKSGG